MLKCVGYVRRVENTPYTGNVASHENPNRNNKKLAIKFRSMNTFIVFLLLSISMDYVDVVCLFCS